MNMSEEARRLHPREHARALQAWYHVVCEEFDRTLTDRRDERGTAIVTEVRREATEHAKERFQEVHAIARELGVTASMLCDEMADGSRFKREDDFLGYLREFMRAPETYRGEALTMIEWKTLLEEHPQGTRVISNRDIERDALNRQCLRNVHVGCPGSIVVWWKGPMWTRRGLIQPLALVEWFPSRSTSDIVNAWADPEHLNVVSTSRPITWRRS